MDISADLTRIALAENGELMELYYESKRDESLVGNLYAGRVANVMPNLQAAFVDIGTGKNGYYYYGNARAVSDTEKNAARPKVGDTLLLQVEKDEERLALAAEYNEILTNKDTTTEEKNNAY